MTTKYIAEIDGELVGKRTTKSRTYTHAVVAQRSYKADLGRAGKTHQANIDNYHYYLREADPMTAQHTKYRSGTEHAKIERVARMDLTEYLAVCIEEQICRVEDSHAAGMYNPAVVTWCGRLDLAKKQLIQYQTPAWASAVIVEAIEV
jgi:hypothetical protein